MSAWKLDVAPGAGAYFMGLGKKGGQCPQSVDWKWNPDVNQDGFWLGAVNGGFKLQLYGDNWRTPLINCYYHCGRSSSRNPGVAPTATPEASAWQSRRRERSGRRLQRCAHVGRRSAPRLQLQALPHSLQAAEHR